MTGFHHFQEAMNYSFQSHTFLQGAWASVEKGKKSINISSPITSLQIDGETIEAVRDFIFLGSNITVDGDCSLEIKRRFPPWEKSFSFLGQT